MHCNDALALLRTETTCEYLAVIKSFPQVQCLITGAAAVPSGAVADLLREPDGEGIYPIYAGLSMTQLLFKVYEEATGAKMTAMSNRCQSFPAGTSRERPIRDLKYLK